MPIAAVTAGQIIDPTTFGNAVADAINPTAWTAPTFAASWVNFGAPAQVAQYRKINDVVHIRGSIKSGTMGAAAFTLPAGFRPPSTIYFSCVNSSGTHIICNVSVDSAGNVVPLNYGGATNTDISLDTISFSIV